MKTKAHNLPIRAVPQSDDHGCGFFALSAVYRYYGLSPRALHLRALLGTDHATPYGLPDGIRRQIAARFPGMKGTLPHDIFAVLYRHGFQTRIAPSNYAAFRRSLRLNLLHGHPALALVDGVAHWVVVPGIDPDGVWIVDSYEHEDENEVCRHAYHLSDTEYQDRRTGEILISRRKNAGERSMTDADSAPGVSSRHPVLRPSTRRQSPDRPARRARRVEPRYPTVGINSSRSRCSAGGP